MRKSIAILTVLTLSSAFSANAWIYVTSCGIAVQTVSPDFFDNDKERKEYDQELEEIYCKKDLKPTTPEI